MNFELTILGSGSAIPSFGRFSTSQVLSTHDKSFMIDCADGTQFRMRELGINTTRMGHIFISHLHGDHCFGLIAVISTMSMMHRTADLYIHSHPDLIELLQPQIDYFCDDLKYKVYFEPFNPKQSELIYEDRSLTVNTIPLVHSAPTCGFLFKEKPNQPHLNKDLIEFFQIGVKDIKNIKEGADWIKPDGTIIHNADLLTPATKSKSYAYCSDTRYSERIIPLIHEVDCLFHEATFEESEISRAKDTLHSTALQAANIAKKAEVGQLLIGHYSARYQNLHKLLAEARSVFPNTQLAEDKKHFQW